MSEVLRALEHMAQHGGKWETIWIAGDWFLTLRSDSDKRTCGDEMFVTAVEIDDFVAEYKQLKSERQAY